MDLTGDQITEKMENNTDIVIEMQYFHPKMNGVVIHVNST